MKPSKEYIDQLISNAIAFGLAIPTSVNEQLKDNGYEPLVDTVILQRVAEILAQQSMFDGLVRGKQ